MMHPLSDLVRKKDREARDVGGKARTQIDQGGNHPRTAFCDHFQVEQRSAAAAVGGQHGERRGAAGEREPSTQ